MTLLQHNDTIIKSFVGHKTSTWADFITLWFGSPVKLWKQSVLLSLTLAQAEDLVNLKKALKTVRLLIFGKSKQSGLSGEFQPVVKAISSSSSISQEKQEGKQ